MKVQSKKMEILEKGALLMYKKGYNHTGIQEILSEAGVPKGSFYFYFKSKHDFGLHVIDYFSDHVYQELSKALDVDNSSHLNCLEKFFNEFLEQFIESDFIGGCPLGNLALEMSDSDDLFRQRLVSQFSRSIDLIQICLEKAIENQEMKSRSDVSKLAEFIFFSWEGLIMQMKLLKSRRPLEHFNTFIFGEILN